MLGKNLATALVPLRDTLKVGLATNTNFVDADYTQSIGLVSTGTNKILNTNLKPNQIGSSNNGGLGYWELNTFPSDPAQSEQAGTYANNGQYRYGLYLKTSATRRIFWWGDASNYCGDITTAPSVGHYYGQRSSLTSRKLYYSGAQIGSTNTTSDTMTGVGDNSMRLLGSYQVGANVYVASKCGLAYFTDGTMTDAEILDFHSALSTYLISASGKV